MKSKAEADMCDSGWSGSRAAASAHMLIESIWRRLELMSQA